ncbi:hypothetical protein FHR81_001192 [Actinoalloteichus hoggarensis]|uniref:hypothetical protein n=1 Tax=Actinoalloteichus hoggarensis TaxID=1470176 RepID=UPI0012FD38BF|nr:hypothetical protein [Actinoalloteichus hoggarensis]MBB5920162.1 hypothetical protein [Actinoalloteichus hoggarensis]
MDGRYVDKVQEKSILKRSGLKIREWWLRHPNLDLAISIMLVLAAHVASSLAKKELGSWMDSGQRTDAYAAGAGVMSLLGGFVSVSVSQYLSTGGATFEAVRQRHGSVLNKNYMSIIKWLFGGALLCLLAMLLDTDRFYSASFSIFLTSLVLSVAKFTRLAVVFAIFLGTIVIDGRPKALRKRSIGVKI